MSNFIKFKDNEPEVVTETWNKMLNEVCSSYFLPPEKRKVCVDVGSNIGSFMGYAISEKKFDKIYGFEPAFQTYHTSLSLLKHFKLLSENVQVRNLAVTDRNGDLLRLFGHHTNESGNTSLIPPLEEHGDLPEEVCLSINLDGIFEIANVEYIDYLKLDCEGAEANILLGCSRIKDVGVICMEVHHNLFGQVNNFLLKNGFWTLGFESRETGELVDMLFAINTEKENLKDVVNYYCIGDSDAKKTIGDLEREKIEAGSGGLNFEDYLKWYEHVKVGEKE